MELARESTITFPSQWYLKEEAVDDKRELMRLADIVARGTVALAGVYMRICQVIRSGALADEEVRKILEPYFSGPRISELLRVSRAPEAVYVRYRGGFFGFKAVLRQCRGYTVTPDIELRRRKLRRTAQRLVILAENETRIQLPEWLIEIRRL